jgi:hypothetical protein
VLKLLNFLALVLLYSSISIACDFINLWDVWINYLIDSTFACVVHYF